MPTLNINPHTPLNVTFTVEQAVWLHDVLKSNEQTPEIAAITQNVNAALQTLVTEKSRCPHWGDSINIWGAQDCDVLSFSPEELTDHLIQNHNYIPESEWSGVGEGDAVAEFVAAKHWANR